MIAAKPINASRYSSIRPPLLKEDVIYARKTCSTKFLNCGGGCRPLPTGPFFVASGRRGSTLCGELSPFQVMPMPDYKSNHTYENWAHTLKFKPERFSQPDSEE